MNGPQKWRGTGESEAESGNVSVPSHYKRYAIEQQRIVLEKPKRERVEPGKSYDGPEQAKKIDLAQPGEDPKPAYIANDLTPEEEEILVKTLREYRDVFAWSYKDLKGVDPAHHSFKS